MKRWVICLMALLCTMKGLAQVDTLQPPYLRFPTLPPIQLLMGDSATKFTKADIPAKKPVLLMLFSPDCSHCQHTAEEMLLHKDELKDIHIVMATMHTISQMNAFKEKYRFSEMPNVVFGKDIYYIMPSYYNIHNLPYMAFYDQKGNLIMGFEGAMPIEKAIAVFKEHGLK